MRLIGKMKVKVMASLKGRYGEGVDPTRRDGARVFRGGEAYRSYTGINRRPSVYIVMPCFTITVVYPPHERSL
jgi:hypothetical protein